MSWVFRKIFKIGPLRGTVSKNGVGMSWGIPGFRLGISPTGKKYISIGLPGTGLYFTKLITQDKSPLKHSVVSKAKNAPWWKQKYFNN